MLASAEYNPPKSQRAPHVDIQDSLDFIEVILPILHGQTRVPLFILNLDRTPVYSMHSDRTLEVKGAITVNVWASKMSPIVLLSV